MADERGMEMSSEEGPQREEGGEWGLVCSFWIDTDTYSDQDRRMFVAGYEFSTLLTHIRHSSSSLSLTIHRENESRVRMACARFDRVCRIEVCAAEFDPDGTWSYLTIEERPSSGGIGGPNSEGEEFGDDREEG